MVSVVDYNVVQIFILCVIIAAEYFVKRSLDKNRQLLINIQNEIRSQNTSQIQIGNVIIGSETGKVKEIVDKLDRIINILDKYEYE